MKQKATAMAKGGGGVNCIRCALPKLGQYLDTSDGEKLNVVSRRLRGRCFFCASAHSASARARARGWDEDDAVEGDEDEDDEQKLHRLEKAFAAHKQGHYNLFVLRRKLEALAKSERNFAEG
jgi:hypothetical protein